MHENLQETHMSKFQQEFKNKSSRIMKTHKYPINTSKIQNNEINSILKNQMSYVLVFKSHLRSQRHLNHFLIFKMIFHPKQDSTQINLQAIKYFQQIITTRIRHLFVVVLGLHCFELTLG